LGTPAAVAPLDEAVAQIEGHVAALSAALRDRDAIALEAATQTLQRTLAASIHRFAAAARAAGGVPLPMQRRIAVIGGQVSAQREQLARASAALERALTVLAAGAPQASTYGQAGHNERAGTGGFISA
jgi:predicted negative regulator of RcsB-dependent stress response